MSLYLDASVLVPLFIGEAHSCDAHAGIKEQQLIVSDLACAEFSAAAARRVRVGDLTAEDAANLFITFDAWTARAANRIHIESGDMHAALVLVRRLELSMRMPDAANLVIAQRLGAKLFTFDKKMAAAAAALGIAVLT